MKSHGMSFPVFLGSLLLLSSVLSGPCGCASRGGLGWGRRPACVLEPGATKTEIIACLNRNVVTTDSHTALTAWRSGAVRLRVDGVPVALPAQLAVQAPSHFRLLVSNPISGGQEVDIGSNSERFWIWSKDQPQVMTASHEDVADAMQELEMPVHIHPLWLMEVFGVVPLNAEEFELRHPKTENGMVELVSLQESPLGEDVERIIKVNLCLGCVQEHQLRLPGGKVLARARLDRQTSLPCGNQLPMAIKLEWPDAQMAMTMEIRNPETNPASLASNQAIWQMPNHGPVVDIGLLAKQHRRGVDPGPIHAEIPKSLKSAGTVQLTGNESTDWAADATPPAESSPRPRPTGMPAPPSGFPEWTRADR